MEKFQIEKEIGWSITPSPGYAKITPNAIDEASMWMWNLFVQSRKNNIGDVTIFFFIVLKLSWPSSLYSNFASFFNSFSIDVVIVAYLALWTFSNTLYVLTLP